MADSSLSYLAGVAAESNINEAIRVEEQRAHASQVRSLHAKIAGLQHDLAFYKEQTEALDKLGRKALDQWTHHEAQSKAYATALAQANARIQALEQQLSKTEVKSFVFASLAARAEYEVKAFVSNVLPSVFAGIEAQHGISLEDQVKALPAQAEAACPLTFINKFNMQFRFALSRQIRGVRQANGGQYDNSVEKSAAETRIYNELLANHRG